MKLSDRQKLILRALLDNPKGITPKQLNEILESKGEPAFDHRKLFKYLKSFRNTWGINIVNERMRGTEFIYKFADTDKVPAGFTMQYATHLLEGDFMNTYRDLGARIQPIVIPRGGNYLHPIGDAMRDNRLLQITYKKFKDVKSYDCILAPHALKAFEGRWYLLAVKWMNEDEIKEKPMGYKGYGLQTFALDRVQALSMMRQRFKLLKDFNAETFFKPFFGVYCHMGDKPKKILIHASEDDAHYIRTLPIHHSQKEVKRNEFTLKLVPARDFEIYMRRFPDTTWEVAEETRGRRTKANEV